MLSILTGLKFCCLEKSLQMVSMWMAVQFCHLVNDLLITKQTEGLTLSQMTNFRLFQTEKVCRRQFQIR